MLMIYAMGVVRMIDKYLLDDLSKRGDEKGELARWVIQLQTDLDAERRKTASLDGRNVELEQRLQQPEHGEVLVVVSGFTGCGKSAVAGEIEIALRAIGLPVTWTNGDAEKRMTGADWLSAIEMYNPRVRIVEQNVARTAGFKVEGE